MRTGLKEFKKWFPEMESRVSQTNYYVLLNQINKFLALGKNGALDNAAAKLPEFINYETWRGFLDMRKKTKKPITPHAQDLMLRRLVLMNSSGQDVDECINKSIINSWSDIYPDKTVIPKNSRIKDWSDCKSDIDRIARFWIRTYYPARFVNYTEAEYIILINENKDYIEKILAHTRGDFKLAINAIIVTGRSFTNSVPYWTLRAVSKSCPDFINKILEKGK